MSRGNIPDVMRKQPEEAHQEWPEQGCQWQATQSRTWEALVISSAIAWSKTGAMGKRGLVYCVMRVTYIYERSNVGWWWWWCVCVLAIVQRNLDEM